MQEHAELVAAFQQHMQQDGSAAGAAAGTSNRNGVPVEASQRTVIRSLASQVASLQQRLDQAHTVPATHDGRLQLLLGPGSRGGGGVAAATAGTPAAVDSKNQPAAWQQQQWQQGGDPDVQQLAGMLSLLKQQVEGLDRIQHQLAVAQSPGGGCASPSLSPASGVPHLPSAAHAAALLGTELPALHATVEVMAGEVQRLVAQDAGAATTAAGSGVASPLCLPSASPATAAGNLAPAAIAAALEDAARRKDKWKARCHEVQAQLAAATSAAQQAEAALRAELAAAQRAAAEQAGTVAALQQHMEELAAAGGQLEGVLQDTAQQLVQATNAAEAAQARLGQERAEHEEALREAERKVVVAEVRRSAWH